MTDPRIVSVEEERVGNPASPFLPRHNTAAPSVRSGAAVPDGTWNLAKFRQQLTCHITRLSSDRIEFDLVGVDASIANALRRVLIAEVPTVAVEHVYIFTNTSIVQDEVLAHRLGLVPIQFDPDLFAFKQPHTAGDDENTLVFLLNAHCTRNPLYKKNGRHTQTGKIETDPLKLYDNAHVTSGHLVWSPQGGQAEWNWASPNNPSGQEPAPVNKDIVLAKLRPGQSIEMEVHCEKGVGKDHAKFSPVATASYRLLPSIEILKPIGQSGDLRKDAEEQEAFMRCFAPGVIGRRPVSSSPSSSVNVNGREQQASLPPPSSSSQPPSQPPLSSQQQQQQQKQQQQQTQSQDPQQQQQQQRTEVFVQDARRDTVSREVFRHAAFRDSVALGRVRDHFLFDVESTGVVPPERLLLASLKVLTEKVDRLSQALDALETPAL